MKKLFSLILLVFALILQAQAAEPFPSPSVSPAPEGSVVREMQESRAERAKANGYVLLNYSPVDLIIPSKYGASLGWVQTPNTLWEIEYLKGTVSIPFFIEDYGKFVDQRVSVIRRSFFGSNSFNLSYGASYYSFEAKLGNDVLSRIPSPQPPGIEILSTKAWGVNIGIGNRWSLSDRFIFGVDWISLSQPVIVTEKRSAAIAYATNAEDKENAEDAMKVMSYLPRIVLFKLQLGIYF